MKKKILIIDRSMADALALERLLVSEGCRSKIIFETDDVDSLHRMVKYDVIFLDMWQYALGSRSFVDVVKGIRSDTRIILTSESYFHDKALLKNAMERGVYGCVRKPFDKEEVRALIMGTRNGPRTKRKNSIRKVFLIFLFLTFLLPCSGFSQYLQDIPAFVQNPRALVDWFSTEFKYQFEVIDKWQTPRETMKLKSGDCEDFAVLASEVLKRLGIKNDILVVKFKGTKMGHAICAWKDEKGDYCFISNRKLFYTGEKRLENAIEKYYPDWEMVIITDEKRHYLGVASKKN